MEGIPEDEGSCSTCGQKEPSIVEKGVEQCETKTEGRVVVLLSPRDRGWEGR